MGAFSLTNLSSENLRFPFKIQLPVLVCAILAGPGVNAFYEGSSGDFHIRDVVKLLL